MISLVSDLICGGWFANRVHCIDEIVPEADKESESASVALLPVDVIKEVLSLLDVRDVVRLDSSLTNHNLRNYFHSCLSKTVLLGAVYFHHVDWYTKRKCSAKILRVASTVEDESDFDDNFETLELCKTANVSEHALLRLLTAGFRILSIQSFHCVRQDHPFSLEIDPPLLEINMRGNSFLREDALVKIVRRCPQLRVINAKGCIHYSKCLRLALAEHCLQLQEVIMYAASSRATETDDGFKELFKHCRRLKVVDFSGYFTILNLQNLADSCRELSSVSLHGPHNDRQDETHAALLATALTTLAKNNTNIHALELSIFPPLSDICLHAVAQYLPNLQTFSLFCCKASLSGLSVIRNSCTKLKVFDVYQQLSRITSDSVFDFRYLQLSMITKLIIEATTLSDAELITIAEANPNMRTLCIHPSYAEQATVLTSNALCEVLSFLNNLETCELWTWQDVFLNFTLFSLRLDDTALYALVHHCQQLTTLSLHGHANLSNTALGALSTLPLLRSLDTSRCANLLDSSVEAIAEGCPLLEAVNFSYCPRISNASVDALARYCRKLNSVTLASCRRIRNCAIQNLIRRARQLQVLEVTENPQISFAAVAELPKFCPSMRTLHLHQEWRKKALIIEIFPAYRNNRRYFDLILGWSNELRGF